MEKERTNVAEILRNCQSGMNLDCVCFENVVFDRVDDKNRIRCFVGSQRDEVSFNEYGCLNGSPSAKCVIFPENKTTWKGFVLPCKFKVGDVVQDKDSYKVRIIDVCVQNEMYGYESVNTKGIAGLGGFGFDKQDEWELVPDKFDTTTLKPFESRVLVRNTKTGIWRPAIWGFYLGQSTSAAVPFNFYVLGGIHWNYCIPYEQNKHLLGTVDNCDEFYEVWK